MKKFNFIVLFVLIINNLFSQKIEFIELKPFNSNDLELLFDKDQKSDLSYKNRKKKKERAAAIFSGLANAALSIAQAANGDPKEGISNFVVNIFNTAAQIAQIEANYTENKEFVQLKSYLLFNYMINLSEHLYDAIKQDSSRDIDLMRYPLLTEYSKMTVYAQRAAWLARKIIETDFVQAFLKEALDYLQLYLHEKIDDILDHLREKLLIKDIDDNAVLTD